MPVVEYSVMTVRWVECWKAAPDIHMLLKESKTLESARNKVARYIEAREWTYSCDAIYPIISIIL